MIRCLPELVYMPSALAEGKDKIELLAVRIPFSTECVGIWGYSFTAFLNGSKLKKPHLSLHKDLGTDSYNIELLSPLCLQVQAEVEKARTQPTLYLRKMLD